MEDSEMQNRSLSLAGLAVLMVSSVLAIAQGNLLASALSVIRQAYSEDPSATLQVRIMLFAPALTMVLAAPLVGQIVDRVEKTRLLAWCLVAFCFCGVLAFNLTGLAQLILSRSCLGFVLALIVATNTSLIGEYFAGHERAKWLGWQTAAIGAAGTVFPLIGGVISVYNWRMSFLIYLLVAPFVLPALRLPRTKERQTSTISSFNPLANWEIYGASLMGALILSLLATQLAFHLSGLGWSSAVWVGGALGIPALACAIVSLMYGRIQKNLSFAQITSLAFFLMFAGYALIAIGASAIGVIVGLIFAGSGFGLNLPNTAAWLISRVAPTARGRAIALLTMVAYGGQFASLFAYELIASRFGSAATFGAASALGLCMAIGFWVQDMRSSPVELKA
jgi:MFS family permease